jgi:hypothetical protein
LAVAEDVRQAVLQQVKQRLEVLVHRHCTWAWLQLSLDSLDAASEQCSAICRLPLHWHAHMLS